ncbi:MAG TPA: sulfur transferase domain-containing protein [Planctomycetota bacterium]
MRTPFRSSLSVAFALALGAVSCSAPGSSDRALGAGELPPPVPVENFTILAPGFAGSAQPGNDAFAAMHEAGYVAVLNLRTAAENEGRGEEQAASDAGLTYVGLPLSGSAISLADGVRFGNVLATLPPGPVLIHCGSGNRVGAAWALWRAVEEGLTPDQAEAEARRAGVTSDALAARVRDQVARAAD